MLIQDFIWRNPFIEYKKDYYLFFNKDLRTFWHIPPWNKWYIENIISYRDAIWIVLNNKNNEPLEKFVSKWTNIDLKKADNLINII